MSDLEGQYWKRIQELESDRDALREKLKEAEEALDSVDIYFKALCEQWAANDGGLVSESGVRITGSEDIERLCEIAGEKVFRTLSHLRGEGEKK